MYGLLAFFRAILKGERLKEIPNDSMSFSDVFEDSLLHIVFDQLLKPFP